MQNGLQEQTFETTYKANTGSGIYKFVKRAFDFIVALVAIVAISPLLLIISAIVYLGDPGPVIYGQLRIGKNGKAFKMWKFRSMYKNADKMIDQLTDEQRQQYITEFKIDNDPRITPVGNFLRKTSLDELPQLFNVLCNDMSLVGPRPLIESEIQTYYADMFDTLLSVKPGVTGFANSIEKIDGIELYIAFPQLGIKEIKEGAVGRIHYYAFSQPKLLGILPVEDQVHESKYMREHLRTIISKVSPDLLHVFGTEYPHSLVAAEEFNKPEKTVVNIQGLPSFYWMHFNDGIPYRELKRFTLSNIARGNLLQQAERMKRRGMTEISTIKAVGHVIGRTDWDEACTKEINPKVQYHFCNESLRDSFYSGNWEYQNCEKHSIFMSQAATPIKGLHFMLRAMPEILKNYPDAHLYIAGNDLTKTDSLYGRLKISSFAKYIKRLISEYNLEEKVTFTGSLTEQKMKERFLKSNVFVSPSTIENSPNSLGEAMLLGVPCISSDVGGVKNMLVHNLEGCIYQADAPYMIAYYVKKVFNDADCALIIGKNAQLHAEKTHNRDENLKMLLKIYRELYEQ